MKRPFGVVLSAIALGLLTASTLCALIFLLIAALGVHDDPPAALLGFAVCAIPLIGLTAWFSLTLVSLLRLRSGARTSVLILAVLLLFAGCGDFAVLFFAVMLSPHPAQGMHPLMLAFYLGALLAGTIFFALGIAWLVYFNQAAISGLFQPAWLRRSVTQPAPHPNTAALPYPQVAPYPYSYPPASGRPHIPGPYGARPSGRFDRVPASIQLMAWFMLFGAACGLVAALLPFPAFLLGSIVSGISGHFVWAFQAAFAGVTGWGLLRLSNRARLMAYAYLIFGCVNIPFSLTPRALIHFDLYVDSMLSHLRLPNQPAFHVHYTAAMLLPSSALALVLYLASFYFLHRHRHAFLPGAHTESAP